MLSPRALLHEATASVRDILGRMARRIVLAAILGVLAVAAAIYLFAGLYQLLLPWLGPAGADLAIAAGLVLLALAVLVALRRS